MCYAVMMSWFANPERFERLARAVEPFAWGAAVACLVVGTALAFFHAPADYLQGNSARIMYVHVPSAWMSMYVYAVMAAASLAGFVWRHQVADLAAKAAAPLGALFTALALVTGAIWGKPTWGTWWQWDARMTSVLVLFFIYLGYMAIWSALEDRAKAARAAAVYCMLGAVNLPIIKFSVDWWNTMHQPASVLRADGPTMPASMLAPLLIMAVGFMALFFALVLVRTRTELLRQRIVVAQRRAAGVSVSRPAMAAAPVAAEPAAAPGTGAAE